VHDLLPAAEHLLLPSARVSESAESGALLEASQDRDEHSAELARNAVVVVLQSERNGGVAHAQSIADGFASIARAAVTITFDRALHGGALRFDSLSRSTQDAWLAAGAAVAAGL